MLPPFLRINPIIRMLVLSDFFMLAGIGFLGPILPIFIATSVEGGDVRTAGFATAIYMTMWIFQIPIGWFIDRRDGDRDDFMFLIAGAVVTTTALFLFIWAKYPWQIYAIQAFAGLGRALDLPAWYSLFTRGVDKKREGLEWGIENVSVALAVGIVGALAGLITEAYGFRMLFLVAGLTSLLGTTVLVLLYRLVFASKRLPSQPQ